MELSELENVLFDLAPQETLEFHPLRRLVEPMFSTFLPDHNLLFDAVKMAKMAATRNELSSNADSKQKRKEIQISQALIVFYTVSSTVLYASVSLHIASDNLKDRSQSCT